MAAIALTWAGRVRRANNGGRFLRSEAGSTTLEFAIAVPVVLLLIFGSMGIMVGLMVYGNAMYASGIAARYAAIHGATSDAPANLQEVTSQVQARLWLNSQQSQTTTSWSAGNVPGSSVRVTTTVTVPLGIPFANVDQLSIRASAVRVITR